MADWVSALLGAALIRLTVTGTVLVSFRLLWSGQHVLAAALGIPLLATLAWYGAESFLRTDKPVFDDGWK
ncbi:MAG: hypothetical protein V5A61_15310 [Haloarculaceae archaeon]